ncbi:DUF6379 domain-containing protein [Klebsiella variicola subsp. variicola]|nr:DUF6379 domain-containing protein [Klebsiella variicola subsp. variicola]
MISILSAVKGSTTSPATGKLSACAFLARLPYYRGLGLSMVEDIAVTLNGEAIPRQAIRLALRGRGVDARRAGERLR